MKCLVLSLGEVCLGSPKKIQQKTKNWLVVTVSTPLKNMKVNGKDYLIYYENIENKTCLKPPIRKRTQGGFD